LIDNVQQLLCRTDFFLKHSAEFSSIYMNNMSVNPLKQPDYWKRPDATFLLIVSNLYFFEALSCLASLLREKKENPAKDEFSFHSLKEQLPDATQQNKYADRVTRIFQTYESFALHEIRNNIIDHKNAASSGEPITAFINPIALIVLQNTRTVVDELLTVFNDYFPNRIKSNYFEQLLTSSQYMFKEYILSSLSRAIDPDEIE